MLIPIGTEYRPRQVPFANYALIALNVLVFLATHVFGGRLGEQLVSIFALDGARPNLYQYVTYQFLHGDLWHLLGNMLFLWIFGNAVCDRMGWLGYLLFYLGGGVFAGVAFTWEADNPMVGASGAIAAVTTAFLALFPRVHITMLVWMFFIFTFQLPAMLLITFKLILWDNVLAYMLTQQAGVMSQVAFSAHLGGYAFGFVVAFVLLAARILPRNQFDLVALWDRWRRRQGLKVTGGNPTAVLARPVVMQEIGSRPLEQVPLTPIERLREDVATALGNRDTNAAVAAYLRLLELDERQTLARPQQLEIANYLAQAERYREAAGAYEAFLSAYPGSSDAGPVLLFLGLLYSRYLGETETATERLQRALGVLQSAPQRALAEQELAALDAHRAGN